MSTVQIPIDAWLLVQGEDAADFLQSQSAQDLRIADGELRFSVWLNHQGRLQGSGWVFREGEESFHIISLTTPADLLRSHLEKHIIADDVEISAVDDILSCRISREDATDVSPVMIHEGENHFFTDPRVLPGLKVHFSTGEKADDHFLSTEEWEEFRLQHGLIRIPEESGLKATALELGHGDEAFSTKKGCFLGQEVLARSLRLGRISRRWVLLSGAGPAPEAGRELDGGVGHIVHSLQKDDQSWLARGWVKTKLLDDAPFTWHDNEGESRTAELSSEWSVS